jgi:AcrR family transcriptional regulator
MPKSKDGRTTDTRQRILQVAEELYYQGGYENISFQLIADQLDVSKPSLFYHFKNKQALFFAVLLKIVEQYHQMLEEAIADGSPTTRTVLFRIMQRLTQEHKLDVIRLLHKEYQFLELEQQETISHAWQTGLLGVIQRVLEAGVQRGEVKPHQGPLTATVFLHLCLLLPYPQRPIAPTPEHFSGDDQIEILLSLFLEGIAQTKNQE